MKKKHILLATPFLLLAAAALYLCLTFPATLRNAYEDSWLVTNGARPIHIAWPTFDHNREQLYRMEQLADTRDWKQLKETANVALRQNMNDTDPDARGLAAIALRYALLAESCLGTLPYNVTTYPISSPEDFTMFRCRTRDACLFNLYFFRELNLPDEVFHQAMEYPLTFTPCTHRSLRLMAEAAHHSHDSLVAQKLDLIRGASTQIPHATQYALPQTETSKIREVENSTHTSLSSSPQTETSKIREIENSQPSSIATAPYRATAFVFGDPMLKLFLHLLNADQTNRRRLDYTAISFLLIGQKQKCHQLRRMCPLYANKPLPPIYQ